MTDADRIRQIATSDLIDLARREAFDLECPRATEAEQRLSALLDELADRLEPVARQEEAYAFAGLKQRIY